MIVTLNVGSSLVAMSSDSSQVGQIGQMAGNNSSMYFTKSIDFSRLAGELDSTGDIAP